MIRRKSYPFSSFKALDDASGTFEAIVSVFGNVDYAGDRVVAGAFAKSLAKWSASGDPIPVIFSHQWSNIDAHVGKVLEARELLPGDALLPDALKEFGGLYIKGQYDMAERYAARLFTLQKDRRIKEFSFAYDILDEKRAKDGANDLIELDVIEVGPTLKGMNPATELLTAKDRDAVLAELDDLRKMLTTQRSAPAAKAYVKLDGSYEELIDEVRRAVKSWASERPDARDIWFAGNEATFGDRVVIYLEMWDDPYMGGTYYEASWARDDDNAIELGEITEVELQTTVVPKSVPPAVTKDRRFRSKEAAGIQAVHDAASTLGAACAAEMHTTEEAKSAPSLLRTEIELQLLEAAS
jgi:HK97 family phage prohead protease